MLRTRFTDLLGCRVPIQQAPMGPVATTGLVAAVADAGGVGMLSSDHVSVDELAARLGDVQRRTRGVYGMNILMPFLRDTAYVDLAAAQASLVEFFYGAPDAGLVVRAHRGGALVGWQVGSADEAVAAVDAGCDLVVAQGIEAGGHLRGSIGLALLLAQILERVDLPVVAAGGIGSGGDVAAALQAGASAVRVGTRFVAAIESGAHPRYVEALIGAEAKDTVVTETFSLAWPGAPHRVLQSCIKAALQYGSDIVGHVTVNGEERPIRRFAGTEPSRTTTGAVEAMALYAGESVRHVRSIQPAAAIIHELQEDAERVLEAGKNRR